MCLACEEIEDIFHEILAEILLEEAGQKLLDDWTSWAWNEGFWQGWKERNV